ncbi:type II toxin-antitoxin system HicB family antitoxin [Mesorhizobium sp. LHD-90]|uniref:type II toxin-antitoxin system HicB family antitoxin n=1 Tax=Mesorhizobium sp. LHD-90 TaxID=3071414 RepID=UPI0027DF4D65|nr:type II toxin-antitoxin system HicB family antitoxin [Mesorhizobium sp. LHD-90]MDQ6432808.1 type II toxin-antitoxin system HicB family antitoxin [Mesorhizobium sp. LHD-90]
MRAYFAIVHKDRDSAYGVSFPDLPGVFSAADEEEDIVSNALEALQLYAEDAELPEPSTIDAVVAKPELREELAAGAFIIRVPLVDNDTRVVRANVTFEAGMLRAIDETAQQRGLTRSAFLASCARKEIEATG